ncbi:TraR/DksA C4-type zinc finger protein [Ectothiorhodospiraceae bacterium 2226]|nr:TraR/DksA C4-type zinc finger protein [Ectothiorhodospiraceae bacterium 2226]
MASIKPSQLNDFKDRLTQRHGELVEAIHEELQRSEDKERFLELAGGVHDPGEESVADLLVDLNLTITEGHVRDLAEIEDALRRIDQGSYGICIDCGIDIGVDRLDAYPSAARCIDCQAKRERLYAHEQKPTL